MSIKVLSHQVLPLVDILRDKAGNFPATRFSSQPRHYTLILGVVSYFYLAYLVVLAIRECGYACFVIVDLESSTQIYYI